MNIRELIQKLNIENVSNYLDGTLSYIFDDTFFLEKPQYIKEQILYRILLCKECLDEKKCIRCTCATPHMFYSSKKIDAGLKWAEFMSQEDWTAFINVNFFSAGYIHSEVTEGVTKIELSDIPSYKEKYIFIDFIKFDLESYNYEFIKENDKSYLIINSPIDTKALLRRRLQIKGHYEPIHPEYLEKEYSNEPVRFVSTDLSFVVKKGYSQSMKLLFTMKENVQYYKMSLPCSCVTATAPKFNTNGSIGVVVITVNTVKNFNIGDNRKSMIISFKDDQGNDYEYLINLNVKVK